MKRSFEWFLVACAAVIIGLIAMAALAQVETQATPTPSEAKRAATIEEFSADHFAFADAYHKTLWDALQAKKMSAAEYASYSHAFFDRLGVGKDIAALYDDANAGGRRVLQMAALALRKERRAAAEAEAATALAKEAELEAE